jgi:predicted metal-dependent hydrolase
VSAAPDALRRGAELFDAGRFFEAHEAWEAEWKSCERGTAVCNLLQGLIQCAAAGLKLQHGELRGARSLSDKGTRLLESAAREADLPVVVMDLERFVRRVRAVFDEHSPSTFELPKLLADGASDEGRHRE